MNRTTLAGLLVVLAAGGRPAPCAAQITVVKAGGHDIPDATIRARFDASRLNLISFLAVATEIRVYDNSREADPGRGMAPEPRLLLHTVRGKVHAHCSLSTVPEWANPIFASVTIAG